MGTKHSGAKPKLASHPKRDEFVRDVVLGRKTKLEIAAEAGVDNATITRYFQKYVSEAERREIIANDRYERADQAAHAIAGEKMDVAATYSTLAKRVDRIVSRAEANEDDAFALAGLESLRRVLKDIAQMHKLLSDNVSVTVALTDAPEWLRVRAIFRELVDTHPEIRPTLLRLLKEEKLSITKGDTSAGL
ncbi:hypothetical protein [Ruegeria sp.]|uniref:hypothetical protein n=1 Tax=Ruegeria sp. TaxID=1879320 RepID=UPI003C798390